MVIYVWLIQFRRHSGNQIEDEVADALQIIM